MMTKSCKVFPISLSQAAKCCVCYEYKNNYKVCTNQNCSDGIICIDCLENMTSCQKSLCPICRIKQDVCKNLTTIQPISLHKNTLTPSVQINNKNAHMHTNIREKVYYCNRLLKIIFTSACILLISYIIGLITICSIFNLNIEKEISITNPFTYIIIGCCIIMCIAACCVNIFKKR
jgi:hypothetical protein